MIPSSGPLPRIFGDGLLLAGDAAGFTSPMFEGGTQLALKSGEFAASTLARAQKGVPIYFTADLKITSKRWWWFDRTLVDAQRTWRIVYNALTQQWRIGTGDLSLPESSLDDSLSMIRHIRGWDVIDIHSMARGQTYHGRIRVRLDTTRLARPFQIDAISSNAWSLTTPWKDFTFSVSAGKPDPS
ncbi:MAG: hypothetical protein B7X10_02480 [Burkholderiales bacterium 21-58-4]|nr:MAG: hypothetical protein B7X10_02480 [Burkholderiales bacterium 21-58-4]